MTAVQQWRSCAALVSHRSNVYLVGGEETDSDSPTGSRTVNRVTRYDCEMQKWSSAPSMNLARRWAAGVVLDDALYVVGKLCGIWETDPKIQGDPGGLALILDSGPMKQVTTIMALNRDLVPNHHGHPEQSSPFNGPRM